MEMIQQKTFSIFQNIIAIPNHDLGGSAIILKSEAYKLANLLTRLIKRMGNISRKHSTCYLRVML